MNLIYIRKHSNRMPTTRLPTVHLQNENFEHVGGGGPCMREEAGLFWEGSFTVRFNLNKVDHTWEGGGVGARLGSPGGTGAWARDEERAPG